MIYKKLKIQIWSIMANGFLIVSCLLLLHPGSAYAFSSNTLVPTIRTITPTINPTSQIIVVNTPSSPQDNIIVTILIALLSGSIGAIIGAVIQARINNRGLMDATERQAESLFQATQQQIRSLYEQERDNRLYNETWQDKTMRQALLTEMEENLNIAQGWGGNFFIYLLSTEAWAIYKGDIKGLPEALQSKLLQAYTEISRYNSMAEFFKFNYTAPKSSMNSQSELVMRNCQSVIEELSNVLKD